MFRRWPWALCRTAAALVAFAALGCGGATCLDPETEGPAERRFVRLDDARVDALARRAQSGDAPASAELCAALSAPLERYFRRRFGDPHEAEDARQHVLLRMLSALPNYRERGHPFRAFVFRLAHNYAVDRGIARARLALTSPGALASLREDSEPAGDLDHYVEQRDSFEHLIASLPRPQQVALALIYQHDMTIAQAAAVLGRSEASVKQLVKRARDTLRELIFMQSGPD